MQDNAVERVRGRLYRRHVLRAASERHRPKSTDLEFDNLNRAVHEPHDC